MFLLALETYLRVFCILLLLSGFVLPVTVGLIGIVIPSARVVTAVLENSHARFSVLLLKSRLGFAGAFVSAIILIANLGLDGASNAILHLGNSSVEVISNVITITLFYLWVTEGSLSTAGFDLLTSGFEKDDAAALKARIEWFSRKLIPIVCVVSWQLPGPYGSFGILTAMLVIFADTRYALVQIASVRRERAPRASDQASESDFDTSQILQISDVHATAKRRRRTDGGQDGTVSLEALTKRISESKRSPFIFVTGDLIDRGTRDEWAAVLPLMHRLRKTGCRVLIVPGNHDLATAYEPGIAERFGRLATRTDRPVDARKLITLLDHAAEIEPELQTCDGTLLSKFVQDAREPVADLETAWRDAREQALGILRKDPAVDRLLMHRLEKQGPHHVFMNLRISDHKKADLIMNEIMDQAERLFFPGLQPPSREERKKGERMFRHSLDWHLPVTLLGQHWMKLWYKPFPLRLVIASDQLEFLILNSNAPEPGLLGSAFGRLGNEQIERLRIAVSHTPARTLVVLMHHPVCGWTTERGDQPDSFRVSAERWAMLAHDSLEVRELTRLLDTAAPVTCQQIFLCSGHRHGVSHAGPVQPDATGYISSRLWVMESAALPDLFKPKRNLRANNGLLALKTGDVGKFKVGRIPWIGG